MRTYVKPIVSQTRPPQLVVTRRAIDRALTSLAATLFLIFVSNNAFAHERTHSIVAADASLEKIWEGGTWLESPVQASTGEIYFSDLVSAVHRDRMGTIRVFDARSGKVRVHRSPSFGSNGLVFDRSGRLLSAQGADYGCRCIVREDIRTGLSEILVGKYEGRPLNSPNDLATDERGRIYFTDPRYFGHEPLDQPVKGVYRVNADQSASLIISDVSQPNGIAISPDGTQLYIVESDRTRNRRPGDAAVPVSTNKMRVLGYSLTPDGRAHRRRLLREYDVATTSLDGIKTDSKGNVYIAEMTADPGIRVISPAGEDVDFIPMPEKPVNMAFARHGRTNWLYITSATTLFRIKLLGPHT